MRHRNLHSWDVSVAEAKQIQERLRQKVVISPLTGTIDYVAGADVSFDRGSNVVHAAIVVLQFPDLSIVEKKGATEVVDFPYVPGLLAFREGPPVLSAWEKLKKKPDVILFDAHGFAHPRRFGLACHLGVILDVPSAGCAKSVLVGSYSEPGLTAGEFSPLLDGGEEVGAAVRTRDGVSPVFVTVGHRVDLASAIKLALNCVKGFRVPEPTRQAHLAVNILRRGDDLKNGDESQLDMF
ncbi:MAG: deoxyribonuclease V [Candidatus Neomarinimicrobiota bacterium]